MCFKYLSLQKSFFDGFGMSDQNITYNFNTDRTQFNTDRTQFDKDNFTWKEFT